MHSNMTPRLSKSRKKRPVPKSWATAEAIESYSTISTSEPLAAGAQSVAVNSEGELAIVGGSAGNVSIYSLADGKTLQVLEVGAGAITDSFWAGDQAVVSTTKGAVKVFANGKELAGFTSHAGAANAVALHPSSEILASVGIDKSFVFYDLPGSKVVTQVYTDSGL
jgi:pre-mRNA-processing factor 19